MSVDPGSWREHAKPSNRVVLANGIEGIIAAGPRGGLFIWTPLVGTGDRDALYLSEYNEDGAYSGRQKLAEQYVDNDFSQLDIIGIHRPPSVIDTFTVPIMKGDLIWRREEKILALWDMRLYLRPGIAGQEATLRAKYYENDVLRSAIITQEAIHFLREYVDIPDTLLTDDIDERLDVRLKVGCQEIGHVDAKTILEFYDKNT